MMWIFLITAIIALVALRILSENGQATLAHIATFIVITSLVYFGQSLARNEAEEIDKSILQEKGYVIHETVESGKEYICIKDNRLVKVKMEAVEKE